MNFQTTMNPSNANPSDASRKGIKGESFRARTYRWLFIASLAVFLFVFIIARPTNDYDSISDDEADRVRTASSALTSTSTSTLSANNRQRDFREIAKSTGTDKVMAYDRIADCLEHNDHCTRGDAERETCRPWGHFYDTIYNRWLGKYSSDDSDPIQFLEIGYYNGRGFEAYSKFMSKAELHSMEISCIPEGPRAEGKWPWGNFAKKHKWYQSLLDARRLHCGDASDYNFLKKTWTTEMKRKDSPPLMVVIDDGAHVHDQMAASLFFWFPRIEPGGILVVEDIQPIKEANKFRTHIVPQVMKDLHWCGGPKSSVPDTLCFPTIQPLLEGVHCEMHICVFVRNNVPSYEPDQIVSTTPPNAFIDAQKCLFGPH